MGEILRIKDATEQGASKFSDFYEQYPRKIARRDAEKCWNRLTAEEKEAALWALPRHVLAWRIKGEPQFIPYPATWLHQARWEDELEGVPEPCRWTGCNRNGIGKKGSAQYCQQHLGALDRGETPSGR